MNFELLADQVLAIDSTPARADVILDLKHTKSVEETINRIFDGEFLQGVDRHPSKPKEPATSAIAHVIIDSDDEAIQPAPTPPSRSNKFEIDFSDDEPEPYLTTSRKSSIDFSPPLISSIKTPTTNNILDLDEKDDLIPNKRLSLDSLPPLAKPDDSFDFENNKKPKAKRIDSFDFDDDVDITKKKHMDPFSLDDDLSDTNKQSSTPINNTQDDVFDFDSYMHEERNSSKAKSTEKTKKMHKEKESVLLDSDSDDSLPSLDDFFDQLMSQRKEKRRAISPPPTIPDRKGKKRVIERSLSPVDFENIPTAADMRKLQAQKKKAAQAEERKRIAEGKKLLREKALEEKKRAKEQKALEKERAQLLEKENRLKNDRSQVIKEMIVDIHPDYIETKAGKLLKLVLDKKETTIKLVNHKHHQVSWRRKCISEWNEDTLTFVPCASPKIIREPFVLVCMDVFDFVKYIKEETIEEYLTTVESVNPGQQIMMLVEGLEVYYKKKQLLTKRQFDDQVRSTIIGTTATQTTRKKGQLEIAEGPTRETVEEMINFLQIMKSIMFVFTKDDEESASWIESLTTDLALKRYKLKNMNNSLKVGKPGSNPRENYSKMLQEIQLCTPAVAESVMDAYPTLNSLHEAYERREQAAGEVLLANLEVERSVMQARDRKINRIMSKKIYTVFNSKDPDQIIY